MTQEEGVPVPVRSHIYEIDLIRTITVFSVVILHALASSQFLLTDQPSLYLMNLVIHIIHYNREMFMFLTGLVLTYVYFGRPFSAKKFWVKRTLLIFIPYLLWSVIYVKINNHTLDLPAYLNLLWHDLLIGQASYQLYYILLALQFYLIFPFFLLFLKKVAQHPKMTLSISLLLQLVFMYLDYSFVQTGILKSAIFTQFILPYQDRIFLTYQFFFIFGAFAAIYMQESYHFLKKYGRFFPLALALTLIPYALYYYHVLDLRGDIFYATSVIQPSVVIYSIIIIAFFSWAATIWAKKLKAYWLIKIISDTSFGIYFVHVFILALIIKYLLPVFSNSAPLLFKISFVALSTFTASVAFCFVLLQTPVLSWTIGRIRAKSNK